MPLRLRWRPGELIWTRLPLPLMTSPTQRVFGVPVSRIPARVKNYRNLACLASAFEILFCIFGFLGLATRHGMGVMSGLLDLAFLVLSYVGLVGG